MKTALTTSVMSDLADVRVAREGFDDIPVGVRLHIHGHRVLDGRLDGVRAPEDKKRTF